MAKEYKGLQIVFETNATTVGKELDALGKVSRSVEKEIKELDKALKLDPENTDLLQKKLEAVEIQIETTTKKTQVFASAFEKVSQAFNEGKIDENTFRKFRQDATKTNAELNALNNILSDTKTKLELIKQAEQDAAIPADELAESVKLIKAKLSELGDESKRVETEIKELDKALKIDPDNVELIKKKIEALEAQIKNATSKTELFEDSLEDVQNAFENGSIDENTFREFGQDAAKATSELNNLENQLRDTREKLKSLETAEEEVEDSMEELSEDVEYASDNMKNLNTALFTLRSGFQGIQNDIQTAYRLLSQFAKYEYEVVSSSVELASELQEINNVIDVTFGEGKDTISEWAKNAGTQFGLTELQAKTFAGNVGAALNANGFKDNAAEMAQTIAGLSADLASFYDMSADEAYEKVYSGIIAGQTKAIGELGISLHAATLENYTYLVSNEKTYNQLSAQEKLLLRYRYVLQQTEQIQGDYYKTLTGANGELPSFSNNLKTLKMNIQNIGIEIGDKLLPTVTEIVMTLSDIVTSDEFQGYADEIIQPILKSVEELSEKLEYMAENGELKEYVENFVTVIKELNSIIIKLTTFVAEHAEGIKNLAIAYGTLKVAMDLTQVASSTAIALKTLAPILASCSTALSGFGASVVAFAAELPVAPVVAGLAAMGYATYEFADQVVNGVDMTEDAIYKQGQAVEEAVKQCDTWAEALEKVNEMWGSTYSKEDKRHLYDVWYKAKHPVIEYKETIEDAEETTEELIETTEELEEEVESLSDAYKDIRTSVDSFQSSTEKVIKALDEQNENGKIAISTAKDLIDAGYATAIQYDELSGEYSLNSQRLQALVGEEYKAVASEVALKEATLKLSTEYQDLCNNIEQARKSINSMWDAQLLQAMLTQKDNIEATLDSYNQILAKFNDTVQNYTYTPVASATNASQSVSNTVSSSQKEIDTWKQEYEWYLMQIDHFRAMDEMSEKKYYDELERLNNKYFKGRGEYLSEFWSNEEKIHAYRLKQIEEEQKALEEQQEIAQKIAQENHDAVIQAFNDEKSQLDHLLAMNVVDTDYYYMQLEKLNNKYYKNNDEFSSEYLSNVETIYKNLKESQIRRLKEQKTEIENVNKEQEKELELAEKLLSLENARKKTKMYYSESKGWYVDSDYEAIKEAEDNLASVKNTDAVNKATEKIDELIDALENGLNSEYAGYSLSANNLSIEEYEKLYASIVGQNSIESMIQAMTDKLSTAINVSLPSLAESRTDANVINYYGGNITIGNASDSEVATLKKELQKDFSAMVKQIFGDVVNTANTISIIK